MSPTLRTALALLLFTGWLALLFVGYAAGGAVHLLLAGALGLFPWRSLRESGP
jgi:hypothetical protein